MGIRSERSCISSLMTIGQLRLLYLSVRTAIGTLFFSSSEGQPDSLPACRQSGQALFLALPPLCRGAMSPGLQHVNTYAPVKDEEDSVGAPHTSGTPMSRVSSASVKWAQHAAKQRPSMIGYVLGATLLLLLSIPLLSRAKDPWDVSDRLLFNQGGPRASQWDTRARSKVYRPRDVSA